MIRALAASLLAAIFASSSLQTFGKDLEHGVMSGFATNALIRAYAASGLNSEEPPPLRLQNYVVTIRSKGSLFEVFFLSQTEPRAIPVVVDARTGTIIWEEGEPPDAATMPTLPGGHIIPGIIAGEIILAYRQAVSDRFDSLDTGAYNLWYVPWAGGSDVGFERLEGPPPIVSTEPAPTPTPNPNHKCFAVNVTGPDYSVTVRNKEVRTHRNHAGCS
jgi:hypothetical protein